MRRVAGGFRNMLRLGDDQTGFSFRASFTRAEKSQKKSVCASPNKFINPSVDMGPFAATLLKYALMDNIAPSSNFPLPFQKLFITKLNLAPQKCVLKKPLKMPYHQYIDFEVFFFFKFSAFFPKRRDLDS